MPGPSTVLHHAVCTCNTEVDQLAACAQALTEWALGAAVPHAPHAAPPSELQD